jgi:hypothetical protein
MGGEELLPVHYYGITNCQSPNVACGRADLLKHYLPQSMKIELLKPVDIDLLTP